jgi:spermidine synthase
MMAGSTKTGMPSSVIWLVAFISGFAALLYQLVWIRKFGLVFGVQVLSLSAVLTAFMTGLALGSLAFGRLADRTGRPWLLLLLMEAGLACFAACFPFLFTRLALLYKIVIPEDPSNMYIIHALRFVFAFLFLLIPSLLMGGTLPVLSRMLVKGMDSWGRDFSKLYAANNLGAFTGCLITGFLLIKNFGVANTLWIGAFLNLSIIFIIITLHEKRQNRPEFREKPAEINDSRAGIMPWEYLFTVVLWVFALEGFTTLGYEVLWTRVLVEFSYDKTTYLFTVIIMSFIFGLSLGSYLISLWINRLKNPAALLGFVEILIGLISILLLFLAKRLMPLLLQRQEEVSSWYALSGKEYLLIFLTLSIPVLLMGMTFPLVNRICTTTRKHLGKRIGYLGFLDTVGAIAGSLLTGFLLVPVLGISSSFMFMAVTNLILGSAIIWMLREYSLMGKSVITVVGLLLFLLAIAAMPAGPYFKSKAAIRPEQKIYYYREGTAGTVTVHGFPLGYKALSINGALFAYNTVDDLRSHRMLGYLPYFFQPDCRNVLVIGYGMGITASCFRDAELSRLQVAEICLPVVEAATKYFTSLNHDIVNHPKLQIIADDGRSWLEITDQKYDIITCDANHPRHSTNLFTREFFAVCKNRLTEDGVMCHWMPTNWLSENEYKSVIKAFIEVFGNASLWYVNRGVTLAVGSAKPLKIDLERLRKSFREKNIHDDLMEADLLVPEMLLARFCMDRNQLLWYCNGIPANKDDQPTVEFGKMASMAPNVQILQHLAGHIGGCEGVVMNPDLDIQLLQERIDHYSQITRQGIFQDIQSIRNP